MKQIRIFFEGMWPSFDETDLVYQMILKNFDVIVCENPQDADYMVCSVFEEPYKYCKFGKIRILYSGENYIPDFNLIDYGISSYPLFLGDRHFCLPWCIEPFGRFAGLSNLNRTNLSEILKQKKHFANFIASHESEFSIRGNFFKKLCEYKRVESPGRYLNNMETDEKVDFQDDSKFQFQSKCKFTLCFESTRHDGFITEKITDAFRANTIPVYYGSDVVKEIFNPKAFINCADFDSFDEVIERIKEIDQDDEKYKDMLSQPILLNPNFYVETMERLEKFICNIFNQPLEKAYRRSRVYTPKKIETFLLRRIDNKEVVKELATEEMFKEIKVKEMIKEIKHRIKKKFLKK